MIFDLQAIREQQRLAFDLLCAKHMHDPKHKDAKTTAVADPKDPSKTIQMHGMIENPFQANPRNVNIPATLQQELVWTNANQVYTFNFAANSAPQPSVQFNNINLSKNQVAAIYAIQILFGVGALANTRNYQSFNPTANDAALYNSIVQLQIEQRLEVDLMNGKDFKDEMGAATDSAYFGMQMINPIRLVSGELGKFQVSVNLINSISGVALNANTFISCRLLIALGQAGS